MINLSKSREFFDPDKVEGKCHIIGCGSVGSTLAEMLVRLGIEKIALYDFDIVESHNIANQNFTYKDIGLLKTDAVAQRILDINPEVKVVKNNNGYTDQILSGYIFMCPDNVEVRRAICENNKANPNLKAVFDFRTELTVAQHYAADWKKKRDIDALMRSMEFSHEEASENTPVSACGITLGVAPTVRLIVAYGVANFVNFIKTNELKKVIIADAFGFKTDVM